MRSLVFCKAFNGVELSKSKGSIFFELRVSFKETKYKSDIKVTKIFLPRYHFSKQKYEF